MIKKFIKSSTKTELICAAAVIAIFIAGSMMEQSLRNVVAVALVPATIGLVQRAIIAYRENKNKTTE